MKENYTQLYPNEQVAKNVGDYSYRHSTPVPQHMLDHHAWASANQESAIMMISPFQAQFQIWMARAVGAKRILEIGCFVGFSGMGWSHAVGPDGHVTTLEFSPEYAKVATDAFEKNNIKNVEVIVGDARESLKTVSDAIEQSFDLIFIDADKSSYPEYLSLILSLSQPSSGRTRLLRPGGVIIADNILRRGLIADASDANPWSNKLKRMGERAWAPEDTKALDQFNKMMVAERRLETFLMPMFDGLGMARITD